MSDTVIVAIISGSLGVCSTVGAAVLSKRAQSASSDTTMLLQGYRDLVTHLQERVVDLEQQVNLNEAHIARLEARLHKNGI